MCESSRHAFPPPPTNSKHLHPDVNSSALPGAFFPTRVSPSSGSASGSSSHDSFNHRHNGSTLKPPSSTTTTDSEGYNFQDGHVDRERTQDDVHYRIAYAKTFIGFTKEDGEALNAALPVISPTIEHLVDEVYTHLFKWDYTTLPFLKRNVGYDGELAESLEQLSLNHPQILFRKRFLRTYVYKIFDSDWEDMESWEYLDRVGLTHTGMTGLKGRERSAPVKVDLMACTLLLGWVVDVVLTVVMTLSDTVLSGAEKLKVLRAFNRIMWIQQDLFQRHYIRDDEEAQFNLAAQTFARRG